MKEGLVIKALELPGEEDMREINRYTRRAYEPGEVYAFSLVLCDNEIDRDFERFSVESLERLRELFLGRTCIFDHERKSANQTARIYHTELERVDGKTTQTGEGLTRLVARAYLPRTQGNREIVELIESGILKEVSVSCAVKRGVCGICGKESCEHVKGKSYGAGWPTQFCWSLWTLMSAPLWRCPPREGRGSLRAPRWRRFWRAARTGTLCSASPR